MVHPSAGEVPVAHSYMIAADVCVVKKGEPIKASRLLYLRMVCFNYLTLINLNKQNQSKTRNNLNDCKYNF